MLQTPGKKTALPVLTSPKALRHLEVLIEGVATGRLGRLEDVVHKQVQKQEFEDFLIETEATGRPTLEDAVTSSQKRALAADAEGDGPSFTAPPSAKKKKVKKLLSMYENSSLADTPNKAANDNTLVQTDLSTFMNSWTSGSQDSEIKKKKKKKRKDSQGDSLVE